jgi:hypothetical protein
MSPTSGTGDTVAPSHGLAGATSSCRQPVRNVRGDSTSVAPATSAIAASALAARRAGPRSTRLARGITRSRRAVASVSAAISAGERAALDAPSRASSIVDSRSDAIGRARAPIHRAIASSLA